MPPVKKKAKRRKHKPRAERDGIARKRARKKKQAERIASVKRAADSGTLAAAFAEIASDSGEALRDLSRYRDPIAPL